MTDFHKSRLFFEAADDEMGGLARLGHKLSSGCTLLYTHRVGTGFRIALGFDLFSTHGNS